MRSENLQGPAERSWDGISSQSRGENKERLPIGKILSQEAKKGSGSAGDALADTQGAVVVVVVVGVGIVVVVGTVVPVPVPVPVSVPVSVPVVVEAST